MKKYLSNKKLNSKYFKELAFILFNDFAPDDLNLTPEQYHSIIRSFENVSKEFARKETDGMTYAELLTRLQNQMGMVRKEDANGVD